MPIYDTGTQFFLVKPGTLEAAGHHQHTLDGSHAPVLGGHRQNPPETEEMLGEAQKKNMGMCVLWDLGFIVDLP